MLKYIIRMLYMSIFAVLLLANTRYSAYATKAKHTLLNRTNITDTRIFKTVNLTDSDISLVDLLNKISKQTNVKLRIGDKPKDQVIRRQKVTVILHSTPLKEVQAALGKLFGFSWQRVGRAGSWEYVLYQNESDRLKEALHRKNRTLAHQKILYAYAKRIFDTSLQKLKISDERKPIDPEKDMWGYIAANWKPFHSLLCFLNDLPNDAVDRICAGNTFRMTYQEMSSQQRQWFKEFIIGIENIDDGLKPSVNAAEMNETQLMHYVMNINGPRWNEYLAAMPFWPIISWSYDEKKQGYWPLEDTDSPAGTVGGLFLLVKLNDKGILSLSEDNFERLDRTTFEDIFDRMIYPKEPQIYSDTHQPQDKMLLKKIALSPGTKVESLMQLLAYRFGMSSILDSNTPLSPQIGQLPNTIMPLYKLLNDAADSQNRIWYKVGSVIVWQDSDWSIKRGQKTGRQ